MKRYLIAIEGEIPVLESDLTQEDFDAVGLDPYDDHTPEDYQAAAEWAASRIVVHTGLDVHDARFFASDER